MAKTGVQTLAKNCPWWPRLMPLTFAAGYLGMNLARFHAVPELEKLIHTAGGQRVVDKTDLDNWIDNNKNNQMSEEREDVENQNQM